MILLWFKANVKDFWRNLRKYLWLFCRTLDFSQREEDTLFRRRYLSFFFFLLFFYPGEIAFFLLDISRGCRKQKQPLNCKLTYLLIFSQWFWDLGIWVVFFLSLATATMTSLLKSSPGRRRGGDVESGKSEHADSDSDTFYIPSKNASIERLQQWRVRPRSFLSLMLFHIVR